MAEINKMLDDAIETEIRNLNALETGSKEKSSVIDDIATLYKLRIDEVKANADAEEKRERRIMDSERQKADDAARMQEDAFKQRQIQEQSLDRYVKIGIAVAELTLPLVFYGVWMRRGFKFEETGSFTSTTFRNLIGRFRPTKRG